MDKEELSLFFKNSIVIVISVTVLSVVCLFGIADKFRDVDTFSKGVYINNVELYGMSYDEAVNSVTVSTEKYLDSIKIKLTLNNKKYTLNCSEFMCANVDDAVVDAFAVGKSDNSDFFDDKTTRLYTAYKINTQKLTEIVQKIANELNSDVVEPYAVFNKTKRSFEFNEGHKGIKVSVEKTVKRITDTINKQGDFSCDIVYDIVKPKHTIDEIRKNTVLISEYKSDTTNSYNRNKNIQLMCSYIDGYRIAAGDTLSINDLVGERTVEKGFLAAPAIMDGKRTVDDIGGGICQLSGTLYNAALLANMQIVKRLPHSWPSDYLPIGLDSTLDWNSKKDLEIKNVSDYDMYLVAWLSSNNLSDANVLHVQIYGQPFAQGMSVKVYSEIIEQYEPEEKLITYTSSMSYGSSKTLIKERIGYRTRTWRLFYFYGTLIDSEIINISYYAPVRGEILMGTRKSSDGGESTPKPTPSSTPQPEQTDNPIIDPPITPNPIVDG